MFKNKKTSIICGIVLVIVLVAIDQLTKLAAINCLMNKPDFILIKNVLQFHYLENTGAAFSMLEGKQTVFAILTPIVLVFVAYLYYKLPITGRYIPLNLIAIFVIAGAIGNYIDRMMNNYVVDFIYFSLINFPVFNVADIYVTCSIILLMILILFYYKDDDFNFLSRTDFKKKEK